MPTEHPGPLGLFDVLMNTSEAAKAQGVHENTILRWVKSGRLKPAHKSPGPTGRYIFRAEEVAKVKRQRRPRRKAA